MNCAEIGSILDRNPRDALTLRQRQDVDRHLTSCGECRAAWDWYGVLVAEEIPHAPRELHARVAAALALRAPRRTSVLRRALVVGSVVLAGVAAATVAGRFGGAPPHEESISAIAAQQGDAETPAAAATRGDPPLPADGPQRPSLAPAVAPAGTAEFPLDPYSIVVLPWPSPAARAEDAAAFAECHAEVLRELAAVGGLNAVASERVAPYLRSGLPAEDIARALGAGSALVLATAEAAMLDRIVATRASLGLQSRVGSCVAQQLDARTGAVRVDVMSIRPDWQPEHWRSFAVELVDRATAATLQGPGTVLAEARAKLLDVALSDVDRAAALAELRQGAEFTEPIAVSTAPMPRPLVQLKSSVEPITAAFDDAVVAAIVQIGSTSPEARAREWAWRGARGVRHPVLLEALLTSLSSDAHPNVRRGAALALGYLVDEPGVRAALARAAEQDPDDTAPIPCCIPSVRGAALRALSSDDAIRAAARSTLLDARLPDAERLRPFSESIDGRAFPLELDEAAAEAVFAIGSGTADALLKSRAWNALREFRNERFTLTLLGDLAGHPVDAVRAAAAGALSDYTDDAAVRAALEAAQNDTANAVRRAAQAALEAIEAAELKEQ
jgi:HEAT repeat protein